MIIRYVAPRAGGIVIIIRRTLLVFLADGFLRLHGIQFIQPGNPLDALFHGGLDEDVQHILMITQHIVRAPAYNHTGALIGNSPDRVKLCQENPMVQRHLQIHSCRVHPPLDI